MSRQTSRGAFVPVREYELKIDDQVNEYLKLKHQLTFFLVTAAVAPLGFTLKFALASDSVRENIASVVLLLLAAASGLAAAGAALLSLADEIKSFQLHLGYRYQWKKWDDISKAEQAVWDKINAWAKRWSKLASVLLVVAIAFQLAFFCTILLKQDTRMHHYGEDSTNVVETGKDFQLQFENKVTKVQITMTVPRDGATEDGKTLTLDRAWHLAREIAHLLRREL